MRKAEAASIVIFLGFGAAGIAAFLAITPAWLGVAAFLATGLAGAALAARVRARLSTPDEIRADLVDRVRNPD